MEFEFAIPVNGRQHKAAVRVKEGDRTVYEDLADMRSEPERRKLVNRIKKRFPDADEKEIEGRSTTGITRPRTVTRRSRRRHARPRPAPRTPPSSEPCRCSTRRP